MLAAVKAAEAAPVNVAVLAYDHSSAHPLVNNLDTGLDLVAGDRLVITVALDDCWAAGGGDRTTNADGLVGLTANPCRPTPTTNFGLYTQQGESFPYAALVGRIGNQEPDPSPDVAPDWFLVGTSFDQLVTESGRLFLVFWDSNFGDNSGGVLASVEAVIQVNPIPLPGTLLLFGSGFLGVAVFARRSRHSQRGGPVAE
jgi:hypothetical protein